MTDAFEAARPRLLRIARRMLGSISEADDALQESWLRANRADVSNVENIDGWLTTVVARVCFDALKRRESRREDFTPDDPRRETASVALGERPEEEAMLADSLGAAMLILLDALAPAERVAFVLHDMFDVPFDEIAVIVGRTTEASRQLASRARRRVRGASVDPDPSRQRHDELVRAFLEASRLGNFSGLLAILDPATTLRADAAVMAMGGAQYWENEHIGVGVHGAEPVIKAFVGRARGARPARLGREPVAVWVHDGVPRVLFRFTVSNDRIAGIDIVGDPTLLEQLVLDGALTD